MFMKTIITVLFIVFVGSTFAQLTQTIRGKVIDTYSEETIPGARIFLMNATDTLKAKSDLDGDFRFDNVQIGRYNLLTTFIGYEPNFKSNLELSSTKELVLKIAIQEDVKEVEGVVVKAQEDGEANNELGTVSTRSFSVAESQRYAGTLNDVARMAQNFAGVQGTDDSRNDIVVRGNSPTGVLYRLEGIDIPNPNHFARFGTTGGPISMLNNNVLANSDFFTGAFPAEYGNALAGVFDLKMRHGNNEKYEFMAQVGFNGLEAMAEGPISKKNKSSFLVNYRYSTLEVFQAIGLDLGTSALPKYQDASFKLRFPSKAGVTQIFGLGGLSNIELLASGDETDIFGFSGADVYFTSNTGMLGVTHKQRINSNSFIEIMAGLQSAYNNVRNDTLDINFENPFTTFRSNSQNTKQSTVLVYQNKLNSRNLIKAGIINDIYFLKLNDSLYNPTFNRFIDLQNFDGQAVLIRPHLQHRFRISENATLVSGLYSQILTLANQFSIEPRIGLNYNLRKNQSLSIGYGLHSQMAPLEIYFRQVEVETDKYESPNKSLDFTKSHHLILGYSKRLKHGINIKSETYVQYLYDVPVQNNSSSYSLLNFGSSFVTFTPDTLENGGNGYNYGLELTIEKYLTKGFYFMITGSIFESKYKGSDGEWRSTAFNSNHTLNVLAGYEFRFNKKKNARFSSALTFDGKFVWNGGGRYTPILLPESKIAGKEVRDWSNTNSAQYKDYLKGNFKIGFKLYGKNATQEWSVDIQNITNRKNVFIEEYNSYLDEVQTTYQTGFLPIIQYRVTF